MNIWLCGMSGPNSLDNLRGLIEPIKDCFSGVVWVLHDAVDSNDARYLESVKGRGKVIHYYYHGRHDQSRNQYLWCGPIEQGDWVVSADAMERINPQFASELPAMLRQLEGSKINAAFLFGKHFIFQYHESLRYQGTPHEGIVRDDGGLRAIDLKHHFPDEQATRYGVRNNQRDPYHFVNHYLKYFLMPWGSNHGLLGLADRGDPQTLFPIRERNRLAMMDEMRRRGYPRTVAGFIDMCKSSFDEPLRALINTDKIFIDAYRYNVLVDKDIVDEHLWTSKRDI